MSWCEIKTPMWNNGNVHSLATMNKYVVYAYVRLFNCINKRANNSELIFTCDVVNTLNSRWKKVSRESEMNYFGRHCLVGEFGRCKFELFTGLSTKLPFIEPNRNTN